MGGPDQVRDLVQLLPNLRLPNHEEKSHAKGSTMKQAVMTAPGKISFAEMPTPDIKPDEALVQMIRIGICGSDIHVFHGKHPYTSYPVVQGHEVSGVIEKVGAEVTEYKKGDHVTVQPQLVCGTCYACTHGAYHICDNLKVMGFQTPGAASEYFPVSAAKLVKLPTGMSMDFGAMVEPTSVAVHALSRSGSVEGKAVLVLGGGPIGNLVAQSARGLGARKVMITDVSNYRLGIARQCGLELCVNPNETDLAATVAREFGPDRPDLILECVGSNQTTEQAIQNARKGTDIIIVGVFGQKATVDLGLVQDRELRIIGTLMYQEKDYKKAVELITAEKVNLSPLVTNHFPFERYLEAYRFIDEKRDQVMKVIIDVQQEV